MQKIVQLIFEVTKIREHEGKSDQGCLGIQEGNIKGHNTKAYWSQVENNSIRVEPWPYSKWNDGYIVKWRPSQEDEKPINLEKKGSSTPPIFNLQWCISS